jgi:hypothetical protein
MALAQLSSGCVNQATSPERPSYSSGHQRVTWPGKAGASGTWFRRGTFVWGAAVWGAALVEGAVFVWGAAFAWGAALVVGMALVWGAALVVGMALVWGAALVGATALADATVVDDGSVDFGT